MSHLFTFSLKVKQFYLTHWLGPIRCYHSGLEWTWEQWQWRGTPHSPKLQHYCSLTIRNALGIFCCPSKLVVHLYSSTDTTVWKKSSLILWKTDQILIWSITCQQQLYSLKWLSLFTNNHLFPQLYSFKYSDQIPIIYTQIVYWFVVSFYGVSTRFGSFNAELSHFDKRLYIWFSFMSHQPIVGYLMPNLWTVQFQTIQFSVSTQFICQNSSISNNSVEHKYSFLLTHS